MIADWRSDTVTRPSSKMLEAMYQAKVGDDVFGEDPTINALEAKATEMFGMEAALYCPSGTMTNQIAIKVHTQPGDEVICDRLSHIYNYEGGGIARNSGASVRLVHGEGGRFTSDDIRANINADDPHFPVTTLVSAENTCNRGGGTVYDISVLQAMQQTCKDLGLTFHLDGARLFNALVAANETPAQHGAIFDTISICLSKGLGAPVGSLLLGTEAHIYQAKRIRKVFGGGMRQAGFIAAGGLYALENNIDRLKEDHEVAKNLAAHVEKLAFVKEVLPAETNIVVFRIQDDLDRDELLAKLKAKGVLAVAFGPQTVRMTAHLDITPEMLNHTLAALSTVV